MTMQVWSALNVRTTNVACALQVAQIYTSYEIPTEYSKYCIDALVDAAPVSVQVNT